jgi:hypothetical protein
MFIVRIILQDMQYRKHLEDAASVTALKTPVRRLKSDCFDSADSMLADRPIATGILADGLLRLPKLLAHIGQRIRQMGAPVAPGVGARKHPQLVGHI